MAARVAGPAPPGAAWDALLPDGTVWLAGSAPAAGRAVVTRPWTLLRGAGPGGSRAYLPLPSPRQPLVVASWDPDVLRYLASSVLSVPPATGPALSLLLTALRPLLRYRAFWFLAAARPGGAAVLVGDRG